MSAVDKDVDRVLTLLRNKIRERGFTQLEVQDMLGWGRSYISQLLTKQKALRLEQVLLILGVVGVDPSDFFAELYPGRSAWRGSWPWSASSGRGREECLADGQAAGSLGELRSLVRGLVELLVDREVIDVDELSTAVATAGRDCEAV
jgi:transcriptional regulator with XRE-family HTH domain